MRPPPARLPSSINSHLLLFRVESVCPSCCTCPQCVAVAWTPSQCRAPHLTLLLRPGISWSSRLPRCYWTLRPWHTGAVAQHKQHAETHSSWLQGKGKSAMPPTLPCCCAVRDVASPCHVILSALRVVQAGQATVLQASPCARCTGGGHHKLHKSVPDQLQGHAALRLYARAEESPAGHTARRSSHTLCKLVGRQPSGATLTHTHTVPEVLV